MFFHRLYLKNRGKISPNERSPVIEIAMRELRELLHDHLRPPAQVVWITFGKRVHDPDDLPSRSRCCKQHATRSPLWPSGNFEPLDGWDVVSNLGQESSHTVWCFLQIMPDC